MTRVKKRFIVLNEKLEELQERFHLSSYFEQELQSENCCEEDSDYACCEYCPGEESPELPGEERPPLIADLAYGFVYTTSENAKSGTVHFDVSGPLHDQVKMVREGIEVGVAGVYQISYSITLKSENSIEESAARIHVGVNDLIHIPTSYTESSASGQFSSTQLYSLVKNDVVKLIAELPEGMSYTKASLQIIKVRE